MKRAGSNPLRPFFAVSMALLLLSPGLLAGGRILLKWDFEDEAPFHDVGIEGEPPVVVADPVKPNNRVMKAMLLPNAKRPERSEVRWDYLPVGEERWVGFRIFRPDLTQMPGYTCYFQLGPIGGGAVAGGGLFQIASRGTDERSKFQIVSYVGRAGGKTSYLDVGPIASGRWEQWVMHLRLRSDDEGLLEVWREGARVATIKGRNALESDRMAIKWGVYVGKGNVSDRTIVALYDDVIVGDEDCRYEDVIAPKSTAP